MSAIYGIAVGVAVSVLAFIIYVIRRGPPKHIEVTMTYDEMMKQFYPNGIEPHTGQQYTDAEKKKGMDIF